MADCEGKINNDVLFIAQAANQNQLPLNYINHGDHDCTKNKKLEISGKRLPETPITQS